MIQDSVYLFAVKRSWNIGFIIVNSVISLGFLGLGIAGFVSGYPIHGVALLVVTVVYALPAFIQAGRTAARATLFPEEMRVRTLLGSERILSWDGVESLSAFEVMGFGPENRVIRLVTSDEIVLLTHHLSNFERLGDEVTRRAPVPLLQIKGRLRDRIIGY